MKIAYILSAVFALSIGAAGQVAKVADTPSFNLPAGNYSQYPSPHRVFIHSTAKVVICYTLSQGSEVYPITVHPPETDGDRGCVRGTLYAGEGVLITHNLTLFAVAGGKGVIDSSVMEATYIVSPSGTGVIQ